MKERLFTIIPIIILIVVTQIVLEFINIEKAIMVIGLGSTLFMIIIYLIYKKRNIEISFDKITICIIIFIFLFKICFYIMYNNYEQQKIDSYIIKMEECLDKTTIKDLIETLDVNIMDISEVKNNIGNERDEYKQDYTSRHSLDTMRENMSKSYIYYLIILGQNNSFGMYNKIPNKKLVEIKEYPSRIINQVKWSQKFYTKINYYDSILFIYDIFLVSIIYRKVYKINIKGGH